MRLSTRTKAAMKNFRANLDSRARSIPLSEPKGIVARGPGQTKVVDPDIQRLIDEALAKRDGASSRA